MTQVPPRDPGGLQERLEAAMADGPVLRSPGWNRGQVLPVVVVAPLEGLLVRLASPLPSGPGPWTGWTVSGNQARFTPAEPDVDKDHDLFIALVGSSSGETSISLTKGGSGPTIPLLPGFAASSFETIGTNMFAWRPDAATEYAINVSGSAVGLRGVASRVVS